VGYEVIDEQGPVADGVRDPGPHPLPAYPPVVPSAPPTTPAAAQPSEPYDLGELDPVQPQSPTAPGSEPSSRRRWLQLERLTRVPGVLAGTGLLVGSLVGGYVVHQHGVGEAQAQARSSVSAVAVAENQLATGINGVRMATLTVRLTNFGPRQLEPVLSPSSQTATRAQPRVEASTPHPKAAPDGGNALVTVTVPLPCDEKLGTMQLPVRTVDGRVHQLDVHTPDSEVLEQDRTMCDRPEPTHSYVTATLVGTPERALLRFSNQSDQGRRVWLQSETASLVPMPGVTIRLSPSLPHDIDPQSTFDLRVSVHADRCIRDVGSYEQAQMWLGFLDTDIGRRDPPGDSDWQNVMGTSIGSVVTAAMLKACP
jgi:hypothetical protein